MISSVSFSFNSNLDPDNMELDLIAKSSCPKLDWTNTRLVTTESQFQFTYWLMKILHKVLHLQFSLKYMFLFFHFLQSKIKFTAWELSTVTIRQADFATTGSRAIKVVLMLTRGRHKQPSFLFPQQQPVLLSLHTAAHKSCHQPNSNHKKKICFKFNFPLGEWGHEIKKYFQWALETDIVTQFSALVFVAFTNLGCFPSHSKVFREVLLTLIYPLLCHLQG